jgi:hypothetical protein
LPRGATQKTEGPRGGGLATALGTRPRAAIATRAAATRTKLLAVVIG